MRALPESTLCACCFHICGRRGPRMRDAQDTWAPRGLVGRPVGGAAGARGIGRRRYAMQAGLRRDSSTPPPPPPPPPSPGA
jgi:hypothetical protein